MLKKHSKALLFMVLMISGFVLTSSVVSVHRANGQGNDSSISPACVYRIDGVILQGDGSCPFEGTPTILSQKKVLPSDDFNYLLQNDVSQYRMMVFLHLQCGPCYNLDISKACKYDSSGNFIPKLSDIQKDVISDLNYSYSIPVCPFMGKPTPFDTTPTLTIIGSSGSVNVMDIGKNSTQSNATKSISGETLNSQTINGSTFHYANETEIHYTNIYSNSTELINSTKNISVNSATNNSDNGNHLKNFLNAKIDKLSPLKQSESGILVKDVQCKQGFILLVKEENGHPGCVKPTTVARLLVHGWMTIDKFLTSK